MRKPSVIHPVGTEVRSYDFPHDETCYVDGVVDGFGGDVYPSDVHYRIKPTKRVWEGREIPVPPKQEFVYPPMAGSFGNCRSLLPC